MAFLDSRLKSSCMLGSTTGLGFVVSFFLINYNVYDFFLLFTTTAVIVLYFALQTLYFTK